MTPETKAALIAKLQDDSVELQVKNLLNQYVDSSVSAYELHRMVYVFNHEYRIKPSTVSLPAVELPKPLKVECKCRPDSIGYEPWVMINFKSNADFEQWHDYINSALKQ